MATYRQVQLSFWTDSYIADNFSAEDKYFYLYALTNLHTSLCGCYEVSEKQIAKEMGYSVESVEAILDRFERSFNLIRYDNKTKELLILNWSKYNWTSSPKFRPPLERSIEEVKNTAFKDYLIDLLNGEDTTDFRYRIDTVSEKDSDVRYPTDTTVNVNVTDIVNVNSSNSTNEVKKRVRKKYEDTPEFEAFWNAYPKQKAKTEAREAFAKVDVPLQTLLDALEIQKKSNDWLKEGGQYIPYPAKWLNKRRWEDAADTTQQTDRYANLRRLMEECEDE